MGMGCDSPTPTVGNNSAALRMLESPRAVPEKFLGSSWRFPGFVLEISSDFPGIFQDISSKFPTSGKIRKFWAKRHNAVFWVRILTAFLIRHTRIRTAKARLSLGG